MNRNSPAEAHFNRGNALMRQGKFDEAIAAFRQAIGIKPDFAEAHFNRGNALMRQGKLDEAVAAFRQVIGIKPDFAEPYCNLGVALAEQGKLDEAVAAFRQAIGIKPDFAEPYYTLGVALGMQGKLDEAIAASRRAIGIKPNFAEAYCNLGVALAEQGKLDEAVAAYRQAIAIKPDYAVVYSNLTTALTALGDHPAALKAVQRSLQLEETKKSKLLFVGCLRESGFIPGEIEPSDHLTRALSEPWGRPNDLARFAAIHIKRHGAIGTCIRSIAATWPDLLAPHELFSQAELAEICGNQFLGCLLESTIVFDLELERFVTALRRTMLAAAIDDLGPQLFRQGSLRFWCALAQQCFINEYIFSCSDEEKQQAEQLRERLVDALSTGASVPESWLAAVAMYFPLASLSQADLLIERCWSAPAAELVMRQVREVHEERRLRGSIPRLTGIDDSVSLAVRQQYEENPYPRWMKPSPVVETTIEAHLRELNPIVSLEKVVKTKGAEILVAGCGTGQHSIETARQFPEARVLAVDLSLTSLCYAERKMRELGVKNLEHAQADILKLQSIGRTFDVIDASGVLHHLAHPLAGWQVLLSILRPGGFMRLGLYSKWARQDVSAARALIAQRGYAPSAEDIRRRRHELIGLGDGSPLSKIADSHDFFSTSSCRDLLFHVQEHQFTLPQINDFLGQNQLEFLSFDLPRSVLHNFRCRFPNDRTLTDLEHWHTFEMENSFVFASMYQFWIRKHVSAP
jgi:tetratricopeptide (TPR) repeat protein/SAM-dependent methyltransferase